MTFVVALTYTANTFLKTTAVGGCKFQIEKTEWKSKRKQDEVWY